jgi:cytochrome P450
MALTWTLLLLERHPDVHGAVVAELAEVLGGRDPGAEDLGKLVVMDRVVKESMRILTAVPTLFLRVCAERTTLGGHELPKGANVMVTPIGTHQDPTLYPEPRRFRPDRWIDMTPVPYGYIPFGAGPRTCVGMLFAERAVRLMLAMILQRFRLSVPEGTRIDRLTRGNVLQPRRPLRMLVEPASAPPRPRVPIAGNALEFVDT